MELKLFPGVIGTILCTVHGFRIWEISKGEQVGGGGGVQVTTKDRSSSAKGKDDLASINFPSEFTFVILKSPYYS